jgi:hypothetical protein
MLQTLEKNSLPKIFPATDLEITSYLRRSCQIADLATRTERETLIVNLCESLGIEITDEEWQLAGDTFRREHNLLGVAETTQWLDRQRVTLDEWSEGLKNDLLAKKLKEHLFSEIVDGYYLQNRENYKRVALSQILVTDLEEAQKIVRSLREQNASFCKLAIEHSRGKQSQENGGFVGTRFLTEFNEEIVRAIENAKEGEVIDPIQTKFGYHILRVEKWFPTQLSESVREKILDSFFESWLQKQQQISNS